jgi:hypothetical protein
LYSTALRSESINHLLEQRDRTTALRAAHALVENAQARTT